MIDIDALKRDKRPQSAWVVHALIDRLDEAESDALEQARLNGMGSEREAALMAKLEAAEKSDAESIAMYRKARDERDALRAKVEAAEKKRDDVAQQLVQSEQGKRKISEERDTYKAIYNEWAAKTEWVQQGVNEGTISAKYLGLHRADVMARLLDEAEKEREIDEQRIADLMADLNRVGHEIDALRTKIESMERQEPVATVIKEGDRRYWMSERLWAFPDGKYALYAHLGAQNVPDVDALAQLIREIDGKHQLGAGALAERIVEWFAAAPEAKP